MSAQQAINNAIQAGAVAAVSMAHIKGQKEIEKKVDKLSNPDPDYSMSQFEFDKKWNPKLKALQEKNKEAMDKFTGDKWRKKFQEKAEQKKMKMNDSAAARIADDTWRQKFQALGEQKKKMTERMTDVKEKNMPEDKPDNYGELKKLLKEEEPGVIIRGAKPSSMKKPKGDK